MEHRTVGTVARPSHAFAAGGESTRCDLNHVRLGTLAAMALLVSPYFALAQTTSTTDSAITELRQLLADQRAALDRQARIIEEQGRTLAALQQRVEGANRATEDGAS